MNQTSVLVIAAILSFSSLSARAGLLSGGRPPKAKPSSGNNGRIDETSKPLTDLSGKGDLDSFVLKKMESIVIPEIEFRQANIADVIAFFGDASREYDDPKLPASKRGVNFVLDLSLLPNGGMSDDDCGLFDVPSDDSPIPLLTVKAHYVTLKSTLDLVMDMAGLKYRIEHGVVRIVPRNAPDGPLLQKKFRISPGLADALYEFIPTDQAANDDPFALSPQPVPKDDWEAILGNYGFGWPIGSSVRYDRASSTLTVRNTKDILDGLYDFLGELSRVSLEEARKHLNRMRELTRLAEYLRGRGRLEAKFQILQILSPGKALCRAESDNLIFLLLYPTESEGGIPVAEDDRLQNDLIWCGTGTYRTVSDSLRTVPQFAIEIGKAVDEAIRQDIHAK